MQTSRLGSLLVLISTLAFTQPPPGPPNQLSPRATAEGWRVLFDGKTLAGWGDPTKRSPPGDSWTFEDGCLKALANPRI